MGFVNAKWLKILKQSGYIYIYKVFKVLLLTLFLLKNIYSKFEIYYVKKRFKEKVI